MTSWLLVGDDSTPAVTITDGETLTVTGGTNITTNDGDAGADTLTIDLDLTGITNSQVLYDNGDALGGISQLTYDGTNLTLAPTNIIAEEIIGEYYNNSGATIFKCAAVYISGFNVGADLPEISVADNDGAGTMPAVGIVYADITNASAGFVVEFGNPVNLDTTVTEVWSAGDAVYINASGTSTSADCSDTLTSTKPTGASNLIQKIGTVARVNASNGSIEVSGAGRTNDVPNAITIGADDTINTDTVTLDNTWAGAQLEAGVVLDSESPAAGDVGGDFATGLTVTGVQANAVTLATDTAGDFVQNITAGAGLSSTGATSGENIAHTLSTDSTEADFLASGALTCGASTQGKAQVHTTPLQYCDNTATPVLRYSAYGASDGDALAGDSATAFFDAGAFEDARVDGSLETDEVIDAGVGGTNLTCAAGVCNVDDSFVLLAGDSSSAAYTWTGDHDFSGGGIEVESSTVAGLPACTGSQIVLTSDGTTGQRLYGCEAGTFVLQGDGGGGGNGFATIGTATADAGADSMTAGANDGLGLSTTTTNDPEDISIDFDYTSTLAGNPALGVGECIFSNEDPPGAKAGTSVGGIICEGQVADTNELMIAFPVAASADAIIEFVPLSGLIVMATENDAFDEASDNPSMPTYTTLFTDGGAGAMRWLYEGATADTLEAEWIVPDPTGTDYAITFPGNTSDTLVARATTDTLTNKTYDAGGTGNVHAHENGTNPTVDVDGEISIDETDDQLVFQSASTDVVITGERCESKIIEDLADADDGLSLGMWADAVTITKVAAHCDGTCSGTLATIALIDRAGNAMTHTAPTVSTTTGNSTFQNVTAANQLAAGEGLEFNQTATQTEETNTYTISFCYTTDRQ
jgi:hypothetical protein